MDAVPHLPEPEAPDPLAALIALLRPQAVSSKLISGAGIWSIRYAPTQFSGFCVVLSGSCFIDVDGAGRIDLEPGDFILLPQTPAFTMANDAELIPTPVEPDAGSEARHGDPDSPVNLRMLGGYFQFDAANAHLLVKLLPPVVHVRQATAEAARLQRVVELIAEEAGAYRAGRGLILERLAEVLLVEALRYQVSCAAPQQQGLLAGLIDPALAQALHAIHADLGHRWTVAELAGHACISRAVFAERFTRKVGLPPMQYLLEYRMAHAKSLLHSGRCSVYEIAELVGYESASAFSTAFSRLNGYPPREYARNAG